MLRAWVAGREGPCWARAAATHPGLREVWGRPGGRGERGRLGSAGGVPGAWGLWAEEGTEPQEARTSELGQSQAGLAEGSATA